MAATSTATGTRARILVVDDSIEMRFALRTVLQAEGHQVIEAEDGVKAIPLFETEQPDIVLLDIMMPGLNGFEVCRRLREHPDGASVPILMVTGRSDDEDIDLAFQVGATDYISKPIRISEVCHRVRMSLQTKRTEDALLRSEQMYRAVVEDQTELICRFTAQGKLTFFNEAFRRFFQRSRDELTQVHLQDLLSPHTYQTLQDNLARLTSKHLVSTFSLAMSGGVGSQSWFEITTRIIGADAHDGPEFQAVGRDISEQKSAEDNLRKLSRAVEQSPNAIIITDTTGKVEYVNARFTQMTGYHPTAAIGRISHFLSSDDLPSCVRTEIRQSLHDGTEWRGEFQHPGPNGKEYWVTSTLSPITDALGNLTHFVWVNRDISQRKKLEETWRRYEFIVNTSKEFLTLINTDLVYEATNEAFCLAHNKKRSEVVGHSVIDVWGQERYEHSIKDNLLRCLAGQETRYEGWFEFATLGRRYVDVTYYPYYNGQGQVTGVVVVSYDGTERRLAQEALRQLNAQNEQLLQSIPSILIEVSAEDRITHWNGPAEAAFGLSAQKMIGRPFLQCGIDWDWVEILNRVGACRQDAQIVHLDDVKYRRPDGKDGFLNITVNPIGRNGRAPTGFLLIGEDVTQRKILESQLSQAQKLESIGQLAAGIAHEINTPTQYVGDNIRFFQEAFGDLSRILNRYHDLLAAARAGEVMPDLLDEIEATEDEADLAFLLEEIPAATQQSLEGINHVSDIVRAVKEFSHPGVEEKTAIDINKALSSTITVARNEWKYVADVETNFDPELPLVPCLPSELNQAMLNILINAAHAIQDVVNTGTQQRGQITVSTCRVDGWVEIRICDTGTGIPNEIQAKVFDPFFTTKDVGQGTGQGLAIAHAVIVEKHNGTISFESKPGRGTCFILRLPLLHPTLNGVPDLA